MNVTRLLSLEPSLPAGQMQAALIEVKIAVNISCSAFCFLRRLAVLISSFQLRYSCGRSGHSCSLYDAYTVVSHAFRECSFDPSPHNAGMCSIDTQCTGGVVLVNWLIIDLFTDALWGCRGPPRGCRADDDDDKWCFITLKIGWLVKGELERMWKEWVSYWHLSKGTEVNDTFIVSIIRSFSGM
jgi:hypothetical protein